MKHWLWYPRLRRGKRSRARKTNNRIIIRWAMAKEGCKDIHSICDDYYYWCAVGAWRDLRNINNEHLGINDYEEWYKKHNKNFELF